MSLTTAAFWPDSDPPGPGLFRMRLTAHGFEATPDGQLSVFQHAQTAANADLPAELRRRSMESGFAR